MRSSVSNVPKARDEAFEGPLGALSTLQRCTEGRAPAIASTRSAIPNWDDLRIFLAVARYGGLMPACRRLGVDHTTVARRMTALETSMGARLIERSPQGASLTVAGVTLLEYVERIESETLQAGDRLKAVDGRLSGTVRLATPEMFGTVLVAPRIRTFSARYPDIEIELVPQARAINLSKREADLAVSLIQPPRGRFYVQKLTDYRLGLYASRCYLEREGPIDDLDDLRGRPLSWHVEETAGVPFLSPLDQVLSGARKVFKSSSSVAQQAAVVSGLGLGVLHAFAADADARLVRVLPAEVEVKRSYWLAVHADQREAPRVRAVIDFMLEVIRDQRAHF